MKKYLLLIQISILMLLCLALATSCGKGKDVLQDVPGQKTPNKEDDPTGFEDPEGTWLMNISESTQIDVSVGGYIRWTTPDNFYIYSYPLSVSICDVGERKGLGDIKEIPETGYVSSHQSTTGVACETGHGYVLRYENNSTTPSQYVYLRLYVVAPMFNGFGEIIGKQVKCQYPFEPGSITVSADTLFFKKKDGKQETVKITTDAANWIADRGNDSWINYRKEGNNRLIVWVDENIGGERIGTITIKTSAKAKEIYIKQATGRYEKGDFYSESGIEGIVYKLTSLDGRSGMIVSMSETKCQWSSEYVLTGCSSDNDGVQNMATIRSFSGWENKYPAFWWCYKFNISVQGWYLPAIDELKDIYQARGLVNQTLRDYNRKEIEGTYWSSTEFNDNAAKYWDFSAGISPSPSQYNKGIIDFHKVRAVHKF